MKRRRLVALVSALILGAVGLVVLAAGLVVTRTSYGQDQIRQLIQRQLAGSINGKLYLGRISGNWLTGVTIDSVAIREPDGALFLSAGRIRAAYDPRDLVDKRVWLRNVEVEHPVVTLHQAETGEWNYQRIFKSSGPSKARTPGRKFGDFVVLDSVRVRGASFALTLPWHPDDSLRGARRDSAIRFNLARKDVEIRAEREKGDSVFAKIYRWTNAYAVVSHIRLSDPDSNRFGQSFTIDTLHVDESYPPFNFRNARASLRHLADSIWLEVPHFDLPASTGSAKGKLWWGSNLPMRWDFAIRGDSVSLADVAWVYPTLPTTGGGSLDLHIGNDPKNLHVMTYRLSNMDVRTTRSRLLGTMTFAVGGPVLGVRDLDMRAQPMNWDLLRVLNGKPFPVDYQGDLVGTVKARGGPLNHFYVDDARFTWRDAHVPGAESDMSGRGELDILFPAFTTFHGFAVNVDRLDLRTITYLYPNFPRLHGTIAGVATLDSSWLDVRFSQADLTHRDGDGEPSRITGDGRVTWGEKFMTYDVDLVAQPLSLTMLARSYPTMPLQGLLSGPIKAKGTVADLAVNAALEGEAGKLSFDGTIDAFPPGYAARGSGSFTELNLAKLVSKQGTEATSLTGQYSTELAGDSLANLEGTASLAMQRSDVAGIRIYDARSRLSFGAGRLVVDTLRAETVAGRFAASGALGLPGGRSDTLHVTATLDSLGGLRRWLSKPGSDAVAVDSLSGSMVVDAALVGRIDSLDATGTINGSDFAIGKQTAHEMTGRFALRDVLREPAGSAIFSLSKLVVGTVSLDSLGGAVQLAGRTAGSFTVGALSANGPTATAAGDFRTFVRGGSVTLRELSLTTDSTSLRLAGPATIVRDSVGLTVDSLVLADRRGARVALRGAVPDSAPVSVDFTAGHVMLEELGELLQAPAPMSGLGALTVHVAGTRADPTVTMATQLDSVGFGAMKVERVTGSSEYRNKRLAASIYLMNHGATALRATASLPVDLSGFAVKLLDDSLQGSVRADNADLAVLEALSPGLKNGSGHLNADLRLGGTWKRPTIGGQVAVVDGSVDVQDLGLRLRGIQADVAVLPGRDSLTIRRLVAWSGTRPSDSLSLVGSIGFGDRTNPTLDLRLSARNFRAIDRRTVARLDVSTGGGGLRLYGPMNGATLTGAINVDRGTIFLPDAERLRKQVVDLTGADSLLFDQNDERNRVLIPDAPSKLIERLTLSGVRVNLGDDVWLRSQEANVKLSGSLAVTRDRDVLRGGRDLFSRRQDARYRLALEGTLNADRGTYNLDLGVVQREFRVQSGAITFLGTADNNPNVDITALYNVKRVDQADLGVLVHIHGQLSPYPVIDFASNENYEISQSDLVSYLVTGRPSFENTQDVTSTVTNVLLPTASSYLSGKLRGLVGSGVQLQGGTGKVLGAGANSRWDVLYTTRFGGEWQLSNHLFVSANAGLCALKFDASAQSQNDVLVNFVDALAVKLDYRFDRATSVRAGVEPSTSSIYCSSGGSSSLGRGLVSTPRQFGLSLLRTWHF